MKVISFSLFGTDPIYTQGALRNFELARTIYPGWECVFYVPTTFRSEQKKELMRLGVHIRHGSVKNEMFWRFEIADDSSVERFIVRDCDSRLSEREAHAVQAWEESGLPFHSMRDHPHHTLPLGGGLWGATGGAIKGMRDMIVASGLANTPYERQTQYGSDQTFLSRYVWPIAKRSCLEHDSCNRRIYPSGLPFPDGCRFGQDRFVGEVFDANDQPHPIQWQQRINHMTP